MKILNIITASVFFYLFNTSVAYAYLDPGSINIFFQAILAAIAGVSVIFSYPKSLIKNFFKKKIIQTLKLKKKIKKL